KALALALGTQPFAVEEAAIRLEYNFPPAHPTESGFYQVYTHGGIAGGFYTQYVDGAPNMQPGDSLAAAGACATNTNRFQPYTTRGYVVVEPGDTFESIAYKLTGDISNWLELYEYNQDRYNLTSPADIQPGMALLVPDSDVWPENNVTSFGVAIGGSLYSQGKQYSMIPHEPCLYLSPKALALRDEILNRMEVPPLSDEVITYRQSHFNDARTEPVIFSGDWNEGAGWSWYGDPWIARHLEKFYHVAQGDMETWFVLASVFANHPTSIQTVGTTNTIQRGEVDVLIYRSSSDPPDMYPGPAFSMEDYYADPVGIYAQVRNAYNSGIPFPSLIRDQSMQFAEFNFTAAEVVAGK
ncbi:MAG: LysM peptidoglycan-binding domain-containing protein, partial [bacterium]